MSIEELSRKICHYLSRDQINLIRRAYFYAEQAHDGQLRHSGENYITHPLAVAFILSDMRMDYESLMAAMLHDVIEDTRIEKAAIAQQFGHSVAGIVDGVSKLTSMHFEDRAVQQAENFQKMAMAMAKDIRVILVKLADRLHNMRTLSNLHPEKRRRIARETLEIYAPIANRLGMHGMKVEFENLGFAALYPMRREMIKASVEKAHGHRKALMERIEKRISSHFQDEKLKAQITSRRKNLYSIYRKMYAQKKSFSNIMDVFGFRIMVDKVDDCYRALGKVHNLFKPIPGRFKDYIAIPKANGYQSLHTTLFGYHGIPIEIQLRTKKMDEMANNGIAAHWLYKDNVKNTSTGQHSRTHQWLRGLLEIQQQTGNSLEFIENVKIDLFPDEVYVFTPGGDIKALPKQATPVDFAYALHTDIGNSCVACKIDRRLASLSQPVESGQTIEIITAEAARPNPAWLNFVTTGKARASIRHYLKNQQHKESVALGRRLFNQALGCFGTNLDALRQEQINTLLETVKLERLEQLLEEIGLGNKMAYLIAHSLLGGSDKKETKQVKPIFIKGTEGMVTSFATCCHPIPGDQVVAHICPGKGIIIHVEGCHNVADINCSPEYITGIQWDKKVQGAFSVELQVTMEPRPGDIANLATTLTKNHANIEKINLLEQDSRLHKIELLIRVQDRVHLARIIRRLRNNIPAITAITRVKN